MSGLKSKDDWTEAELSTVGVDCECEHCDNCGRRGKSRSASDAPELGDKLSFDLDTELFMLKAAVVGENTKDLFCQGILYADAMQRALGALAAFRMTGIELEYSNPTPDERKNMGVTDVWCDAKGSLTTTMWIERVRV